MNFAGTSLPAAVPSADGLAVLRGLLDLMSDPQRARDLITELGAATAAARAAVAEAEVAKGDLARQRKEHDEYLAATRQAAEAEIASKRDAWSREVSAREQSLASRETDAEEALRRAVRHEDAAAKVQEQLEAKLTKLRSLAA